MLVFLTVYAVSRYRRWLSSWRISWSIRLLECREVDVVDGRDVGGVEVSFTTDVEWSRRFC